MTCSQEAMYFPPQLCGGLNEEAQENKIEKLNV